MCRTAGVVGKVYLSNALQNEVVSLKASHSTGTVVAVFGYHHDGLSWITENLTFELYIML